MAVVSMKQFIEAGVHFGHQTKRWNPRMKPYIFGAKNGIHIIDLQKSLRKLKEAYEFTRDLSARGESVLFVGTKIQARNIIAEEAVRGNSYYINERWLGGLLTNFNTVKQSISKLKKLEEQRGENGLYDGILKKEAVRLERKRAKLERALGGIKEMRRLPGALFVVDCKKERIALDEARKLGVPIIAVVDTNCDPENIDIVVPGNDDAIRAIRLFSGTIANAILEGRGLYDAQMRNVEAEKAKKAAKQPPKPAPKAKEGGESKPAAAASAAEPKVEPSAASAAEPKAEPSAASAAEPKAEPPVATAAEPAAKAASEPATAATPAEPAAKAAPEPVAAVTPAEPAQEAPKAPENKPAQKAEVATDEAPKDAKAADAEKPKKAPAKKAAPKAEIATDEAPKDAEKETAAKAKKTDEESAAESKDEATTAPAE